MTESPGMAGCDISAGMLAWRRSRARQQGLAPRLYRQAMHELDLPRVYRRCTCAAPSASAGTRDHDQAALRGFRNHLRPGGALVMDTHLPYREAGTWQYWLKETVYFRNELLMMFQQAGFGRIRVEGGYDHAEPACDSGILVFIAHKPPG